VQMTLVPDLSATAARVQASVVQVRPGEAGGAGVVLRKRDGALVIITNAHVVRGEVGAEVSIVADRGEVRTARVERIDGHRDIAYLYLTPSPLSMNGEGDLLPAEVGDLSAVRPGHLVVAVGHPFGLPNAVTAGIIHSVGPVRWDPRLGNGRGLSWIQADIRLAPGNSGGPLSDMEGRVIGINTMVAGGLALAVPIAEVEL
jgi:serine protease Do